MDIYKDFIRPQSPFLLIMQNADYQVENYWCQTKDEMNETKIELERTHGLTAVVAIEIGSYRDVKLKKFKQSDKVYHTNLDMCGTFIDYAWESDDECDIDFEMEDGEIEQRHVSVDKIVLVDELKNMKSCGTCGCKDNTFCNTCEEYNKWFCKFDC